MAGPLKIIVLEGDETGQELLEASLAVLDRALIGARGQPAPGQLSGPAASSVAEHTFRPTRMAV